MSDYDYCKDKATREGFAFNVSIEVWEYEHPGSGRIEIMFKKPSLHLAYSIKNQYAVRSLADFHKVRFKEAERHLNEGIDIFLAMIKRELDGCARLLLENLKAKELKAQETGYDKEQNEKD